MPRLWEKRWKKERLRPSEGGAFRGPVGEPCSMLRVREDDLHCDRCGYAQCDCDVVDASWDVSVGEKDEAVGYWHGEPAAYDADELVSAHWLAEAVAESVRDRPGIRTDISRSLMVRGYDVAMRCGEHVESAWVSVAVDRASALRMIESLVENIEFAIHRANIAKD